MLSGVIWLAIVAALLAYAATVAWAGLRLLGAPRNLGNSLAALWIAVVPVIGIEVYFQYVWARSDSYGWLSRNFARQHYHADVHGYRDSGLPLSEERENLVIVGDSLVFGAGLEDAGQRYANLVRLARPDLHVVVLSTIGGGTRDETRFLARHARSQARTRAVILNYTFNDIQDATPEDFIAMPPGHALWKPYFERIESLRHLYYRVAISERAYDVYRTGRLQEAYADPGLLAAHTRDLRAFGEVARERYRAPVVLVLWPDLTRRERDPAYERIAAVGEAQGFAVVDLVPALVGHEVSELVVSERDRHPSPLANRLIADRVLRSIPGE